MLPVASFLVRVKVPRSKIFAMSYTWFFLFIKVTELVPEPIRTGAEHSRDYASVPIPEQVIKTSISPKDVCPVHVVIGGYQNKHQCLSMVFTASEIDLCVISGIRTIPLLPHGQCINRDNFTGPTRPHFRHLHRMKTGCFFASFGFTTGMELLYNF